MRVVFFGSGEFAVPSLRWLINSPHEIVAVVTQPDRPAGRGKKPSATPVASCAEEHHLPLERTVDVNAPEFVQRARSWAADLGLVVAFGQKLSTPVRAAFRCECVNLHASLLPKFRGAAPIAHAILAGEPVTGVTVFRLVDRLDAGPIIVQRRTAIGTQETAGELHDRLARIGCDAVGAALAEYEESLASGGPPGVPQDESMASSAPKLSKADGYLAFNEPAEQIARRCRALWPWPGARCRYAGAEGRSEEIAIAAASAVPGHATKPAGMITDVLTVAAADGMLEIQAVQPAGKRVMSWRDFVNGRHVQPGDRLEQMKNAK